MEKERSHGETVFPTPKLYIFECFIVYLGSIYTVSLMEKERSNVEAIFPISKLFILDCFIVYHGCSKLSILDCFIVYHGCIYIVQLTVVSGHYV